MYYLFSALLIAVAAIIWLAYKKSWLAMICFGVAFAVLSLKNVLGPADDYALIYNLGLATAFIVKGISGYKKSS